MRYSVGFICDSQPTHPHGSKNVWLCRLESYIAKRFKIFHEFLSLFVIWLVISFFQIGCKIEKLVLWMSWCTAYVFWTLSCFYIWNEGCWLAVNFLLWNFVIWIKRKCSGLCLPSHTYMLLRFDILCFKI